MRFLRSPITVLLPGLGRHLLLRVTRVRLNGFAYLTLVRLRQLICS